MHEDIQIGLTEGHKGDEPNFKNCNQGFNSGDVNLKVKYSSFVDLRDKTILKWIRDKVPDVFVVGNIFLFAVKIC